MSILGWIHNLFNPHCQECSDDGVISNICESCETLKAQLNIANHEKKQLLESLLDLAKPRTNAVESKPDINYEAIKPTSTTWSIRKHMLEAESRERAKLMSKVTGNTDEDKEIQELEKQLGIES